MNSKSRFNSFHLRINAAWVTVWSLVNMSHTHRTLCNTQNRHHLNSSVDSRHCTVNLHTCWVTTVWIALYPAMLAPLRCVVRCNYRWKVNGPYSTRQRRRCAHLWKKTVLPPKTMVFTPLIQTYGQLTVQYASQNLTHQVAPGRQRQAASWLPACWPGHVSQRTDRVLSSPRRVQWIATSRTEHHTPDNCDGLHTYLFCFFPVI